MAKKILLITLEYTPQKGGVASYYGGLVEELKRQGHEVDVISSGLLSKWIWPRWLKGYFVARQLICRGRTSGQTEARPPDVVFVGQVLPLGTIAYFLRKHIPYVVFTHGMDILTTQKSWRKRWLMKKIVGHAKLVVANSEFTRNLLTAYSLQLTAAVVYPCPNIVADANAGDVEQLRQRLGLGGKKVLLTLGRVVKRKGHDLIIAALPEIVKHVPEAVYVVAGDGPDLGRLQTLVSSPSGIGDPQSNMRLWIPAFPKGTPSGRGNDKISEGLQSAVRFVGKVSDEERAAYFALCDLFVMPSRQIGADVEGFGLVFLEAAMFGKPSIGGRSGGQSEAILDGKTGALVDPNDPAAFARVAVQLLRDDGLRHELGQNAKARAVHEFRWEKQVGKLLQSISSH